MRIRIQVFSFLIVIVFVFAVALCANAAESECKGLKQQACEGQAGCSWVRGYTTSKGVQVSAFCRRKPVRKKSSLDFDAAKISNPQSG